MMPDHVVTLTLSVDGEAVDTLTFEGQPATVSIECLPAGIVAVAFSVGDDGPPPLHYMRSSGGGYEGAHTHLWRKVDDGRPGKPARAWRLVRAVGWRPDEYQNVDWSEPEK